MKLSTHLLATLAAVTCLPTVTHRAQAGDCLLLVLAGVAGVLPDLLDGFLVQPCVRADVEIVPDPLGRWMRTLADGLNDAIGRVRISRQPVTVRVQPVQVGPNASLAWRVRFNNEDRTLEVQDRGSGVTCRVPLPVEMAFQDESALDGDGNQSTLVRFTPALRNRVGVSISFWQRTWTHSIWLAIVLALLAGLGMGGWGAVLVLGSLGFHFLLDHLDFTGWGLGWPWTGRRSAGWKRFGWADALPNAVVQGASAGLLGVNLLDGLGPCTRIQALLVGAMVPLCVTGALRFLRSMAPARSQGSGLTRVGGGV
jgi:hypothetical protein